MSETTQLEAKITSPIICPHCGADDNEYEDFPVEGGVYYIETDCGSCERRYEVFVHLSVSVEAADTSDDSPEVTP